MKVSIVIPVYRSENIIQSTTDRLIEVTSVNNLDAEIILVNDGSPDNSWEVIKSLANKYNNVKSINLVKNYGQHNAVLCGFEEASGDYVITMDDDLQNPPSEIIHLINKIKGSDLDLVFGEFKTKKHPFHRKLGTKLIGYLNTKVFDKPKEITLTNFRIIRRDLLERVLQHQTSYPYIPGLLLMYASKVGNTLVEHHERAEGASNYTWRKILSLVARLLINYSSYPLKLLSGIGLGVAAISFMAGVLFLVKGVMYGSEVEGWTTLVVLISFFGGFIIALLGLIGEYLSRILDQLSCGKSYFIKEKVK